MSPRLDASRTRPEARRAKPPVPPARSRAALEAEAKRHAFLRARKTLESRSVLRGLILLAVLVVLVSLLGAGLGRAFYTGWWRHW